MSSCTSSLIILYNMAACSSLDHIFEKPLPESRTLLDTLSTWNHIKSMNGDSPLVVASEIFGELHFQEAKITTNVHQVPENVNSSLSPWPAINGNGSSNNGYHANLYRDSSNSFSSMTSDSLSICTEGLGSESFDEVEDLLNNNIYSSKWQQHEEKKSSTRNSHNEARRSTADKEDFPPPISCIARNGKPWVCFKSYRKDGRFILKKIRIPTKEFLHAVRENGTLKLHSIQSDDDDDNNDDDVLQEGTEEEECTNEEN